MKYLALTFFLAAQTTLTIGGLIRSKEPTTILNIIATGLSFWVAAQTIVWGIEKL